MDLEDKIRKLIDISKKTVVMLKRKMNATHTIREMTLLKEQVYQIQTNIFLLSEIVNNLDELREGYSNEELKNFFENIKRNIKTAQNLL